MYFHFKRHLQFLYILLITSLITILSTLPLEIIGKIYTQNKEIHYEKHLGEMEKSLILLTVTGNKIYNNKELVKIYYEANVIHILVISAGNIILLLNFIHIFIYRKSKTNYLYTLFFIYFYGRVISFPETFIRAIQTIGLLSLIETYGLKVSKLVTIFLMISFFITFYFLFDLSKSYQLSAIFSTMILISGSVNHFVRNKVIGFIITNLILSITSSTIFSLGISGTCISFFANIFVSLFYDSAIYLSYTIFILPTEILPNSSKLLNLTNLFLSLVIKTLDFVGKISYNYCNEYGF